MRQHDDIERLPGARGAKFPPDNAFQFRLTEERHRGESADGDDQSRLKQLDLAIEMCRAIRNLVRRRHAIAARLLIAAGKAANHRAHVDAASKLLFVDAEGLEPAEETPSSGVRERPLVFDFVRARRLADEHHPGAGDRADDRLAENIRTKTARRQRREMLVEVHAPEKCADDREISGTMKSD